MFPESPFLPGICHRLQGRAPRKESEKARAQMERLAKESLGGLCEIFGKWIPAEALEEERSGVNSRRRIYTLRVSFWSFLSQVLAPGSSCREAVRKVQRWHGLRQKALPDSNTSAYCQARARLPMQRLQRIQEALTQRLEKVYGGQRSWRGFRVRIVDGTGVSMPDTVENQQRYPQPKAQKPGCGFPVAGLGGLFCWHTGALIQWVYGRYSDHECRLFAGLLKFLNKGDLVLADRAYCGYGQLCELRERGVHAVVRLHQMRLVNWKKGKVQGKHDTVVEWERPQRRPLFEKERWQSFPKKLAVRLIGFKVTTPGFRPTQIFIATTLLEAETYRAQDICELYLQRWQVEVFFRDIKQSLAMDILRCKTPDMVEKEVMMHAIAYNLIRALMGEAAWRGALDWERIRFKGVLDALRQWACAFESSRSSKKSRSQLRDLFFQCLIDDPLTLRPNRFEPRVLKRRPMNYSLMTRPRQELRFQMLHPCQPRSSRQSLN